MFKVLAFVLMVIADQISKFLAVSKLQPIGSYELFPNVLHLTYVENTGAAFSMLSGKTTLLIVLPIVVCAAIGYFLIRGYIKNAIEKWSLVLILSGAVGNVIDRIFRGAVVDFFEIKLFKFAIFNVADIFVTIGAVLLFVYILFLADKKGTENDGNKKNNSN